VSKNKSHSIEARNPLDNIEPVSGILISQNIALPGINHPGSINSMKCNRNKDDKKFHDKNPRETPHCINDSIILLGSPTCGQI
jgi:hypothetical protein